MMKLLVLLMVLVTSTAHAADEKVPAYIPEYEPTPPIQTIPQGDDQIVALPEGEPAPFNGQLFSPATALRWANWLTQYRTRLVQDVLRERNLCVVEITHRDELRTIEEDRNAKVEAALNAGLLRSEQRNAVLQDKINDPSFFRSMEFGLILGVVATAGGAIAITVAAN